MIKLTTLEGSHIVLTLSSVLELIQDGAVEDISYLAEDIEESLTIITSSMKEENEDFLDEFTNDEN